MLDSLILFRFSCRLQIPCLDILAKWRFSVGLFIKEMQFVQTEYTKHKDHPPLARNLPPTSGRIAWSRQLYHRISVPMSVFKKNPKLMDLPETKKAIKRYNHLAQVLVEYELVFHQMWRKHIVVARASLNSTVLIRHPETKELLVNCDHRIIEVLREIDVLSKMGLELPPQARVFVGKKEELRKMFAIVEVSGNYSMELFFSLSFFLFCTSLLRL